MDFATNPNMVKTMETVLNDPNMRKYLYGFFDLSSIKEFTTTNKTIYNISKSVYHDFIYDINCFNNLSYDYKLERVRKIDKYNGEIIDSKILVKFIYKN